ncbi:MAG: hypothetical protein IPK97_09620 [Ahniella sp.]|nr:hypothetical protein [Ahniella sp.]
MNTISSLLGAIPTAVWPTIAGALIALAGVFLSNASHNKRLRVQLANDAAEKSKERIATLRRDVYLKAAEEMVKAGSFLAGLPQADLTKANAGEGLQAFFGSAAKLQLVAEPKTALLVNELSSAYGGLLMHALARLIPLQDAKSDRDIQDELYKRSQAEVSRVLSDMAKFNESANIDERVFAALRRAFEWNSQTSNRHAELRDQAWDRINVSQRDFSRRLFLDLRNLGDLQVRVMVEIRRDLGLTSDLEAFRNQMNCQWQKMESQLNAVLQQFEQQA